jgi:hypothetical protein
VPVVSNGAPTPFTIPPGIMDRIICILSGTEPSNWCRSGQRNEFFASDQPPLPSTMDLLYETTIDTWTGLIAGNACEEFATREFVINLTDEWARRWLGTGEGRNWLESNNLPNDPFFAPERECSITDPRPVLEFTNLDDGSVITEVPLDIRGIIDVRNGSFTEWRLEYGAGEDPSDWTLITEGRNAFPNSALIHTWDLEDVDNDRITLRIYLMNGDTYYAERRVVLRFNLPTPTPTETPSPTLTLFPPTDIPTETPAPPTETPTVTPTETPTTAPPPP